MLTLAASGQALGGGRRVEASRAHRAPLVQKGHAALVRPADDPRQAHRCGGDDAPQLDASEGVRGVDAEALLSGIQHSQLLRPVSNIQTSS